MIELLVVIAIIGILAALLLPALSRAKATAKRIHCVGNVKQLSLATHLYADDHQDWLPPSLVDLDMRVEGGRRVFFQGMPRMVENLLIFWEEVWLGIIIFCLAIWMGTPICFNAPATLV